MPKLNDLTSKTFGNWKVLYRNGSDSNKNALWRCKCLLCGKEQDVRGSSLTQGLSTKCRACVPKVTLSKPNRNTRLYHIWTTMKQRCENPNNKSFSIYGGRGISVCDEWKTFDAFCEWSVKNGYSEELSIDRIDTDGNYTPQNCRWIPLSEQASNRRCCIQIKYCGKTYTLTEACRRANLNLSSVCGYWRKHKELSRQECFNRFLK